MRNTFFDPLLVLVAGLALLCGEATCVKAQKRVSHGTPKKIENAPNREFPQSIVRARSGETLSTIAERANVSNVEVARLNGLAINARLRKGQRILLPASSSSRQTNTEENQTVVIGQRIRFADGTTLDVDEAWRQGAEVWFRRGGVVQNLTREVRSIEPISSPKKPSQAVARAVTHPVESKAAPEKQSAHWIYLHGGARFKVDEIRESSAGVWYSRANLSVFLERERVARIEIDRGEIASPASRGSDWTSGNATIDQLIKQNGSRFGVDPYLVFLVIEQESRFHPRAVSPKGARGLMQLMSGTARRFGVKNSFDIAENIKGGTQYLRELMDMFGGDVHLVLASYNAGEGAVLKYGRNVPPYRETREYVKKIGKRYGLAAREPGADNESSAPRR